MKLLVWYTTTKAGWKPYCYIYVDFFRRASLKNQGLHFLPGARGLYFVIKRNCKLRNMKPTAFENYF